MSVEMRVPTERQRELPLPSLPPIAIELQTVQARVLPNTNNTEVQAMLADVPIVGTSAPQDLTLPALPTVPGVDVQGQCQLFKSFCISKGWWPGK
jgi:hypothetical protein